MEIFKLNGNNNSIKCSFRTIKNVAEWNEYTLWSIHDFPAFLELIGLKNIVRIRGKKKSNSIFECIDKENKSHTIQLTSSSKENTLITVWETDENNRKYRILEKFEETMEPKIILNKLYRKNKCEYICFNRGEKKEEFLEWRNNNKDSIMVEIKTEERIISPIIIPIREYLMQAFENLEEQKFKKEYLNEIIKRISLLFISNDFSIKIEWKRRKNIEKGQVRDIVFYKNADLILVVKKEIFSMKNEY